MARGAHEIGHHGWTHRIPASLSREGEERELVRGNEAIKKLTGQYARGYRSPSWDLSPHSIELLLKHGFVYDSSLMGHDYLPYQARDGDIVKPEEPLIHGPDTKLVEMPISWSLDDFPAFEYYHYDSDYHNPGLRNAGLVLENWLGDFTYMRDNYDWGIITYTFHPARDRPRPPHDHAGEADPGAERRRRQLHHHGGRRGRIPRPSSPSGRSERGR